MSVQTDGATAAKPAGAERIEEAFRTARDEGRAALMPYMMGGFPDARTSAAIARSYADSGADLIELGVPFSDPLADGPVIHAAATEALHAGVKLDDVLGICREVCDRVVVVLMAYTNTILGGGGPTAFGERAVAAGASGVIVPDLPLGEDEAVREALIATGLAVVPLIAPTTLGERRAEICRIATGFIYVVAEVGTTGERDRVPDHLQALVTDVASKASVPVAVGFGIGTPEHAAVVGGIAEGVIIGSKLVRLAGDAGPDGAANAVGEFLSETSAALRGG